MMDVVLCARRRDDMSLEEFQRYWRDEHAPLVASHAETLGMLSYVLHLTLDTGLESIVQDARGCSADVYDGIAVLSFESLDELAAKGAEPAALAAAEALAADERRLSIMPRAGSGSPSITPSSERPNWRLEMCQ